jgi:repressor LexA
MPAKPAQLLDPSEFAPVSAVPKAKAATQGKKPVPALERVALLETGDTQVPEVQARAAGGTRARSTETPAVSTPAVTAAEEHLRALARKGVIELTPGASRGIRLKVARSDSELPDQFSLPMAGVLQLTLPLVGRVAAGSPILAAEHIDRQYQVDASVFDERPDYLLRVRGLSMRDAGILDGDLLAVRRASEAANGKIVVARLGDDVTVKRLQRRGGHIELIAENPDFTNIIVEPGEEFSLEGIAVGLIRSSGF